MRKKTSDTAKASPEPAATRKSPVRQQRSVAARAEALKVARELLVAGGPAAVTLKAVGDRLGISHANILYHFGSASGLQGELMDSMVLQLAERISVGISNLPPSAWEREKLIDVVFDAYGEGGGAQLAAWLTIDRGDDHQETYGEMVRSLADNLSIVAENDPQAVAKARSIVLAVIYMAFADGLIGNVMSDLLQTSRALGRRLALAFVDVVVDGGAR